MNKQGKEDHTGEWTALLALAMVGIIMLVLLYVQEGQTYVNLVPAIVSGLLFIPAVWLAVQVQRTGAYLLTLPLLLSSLMAVAIAIKESGTLADRLESRINNLNTRIDGIEGSTITLATELSSLQVTAHENWFESEGRLHHNNRGIDNLRDIVDQSEGKEIKDTGPNDACFISSLNWYHHGDHGSRLVRLVRPTNGGPWRIIALHSHHGDSRADWVHAQVMCIRLPDPAALQGINLSEAG